MGNDELEELFGLRDRYRDLEDHCRDLEEGLKWSIRFFEGLKACYSPEFAVKIKKLAELAYPMKTGHFSGGR